MEKIAFCVIAFESIKIQTHSAPQIDRLNFSFVKDFNVTNAELMFRFPEKATNQHYFENYLSIKTCSYLQMPSIQEGLNRG